jgi:hypothetical protein
VPKTDSQKTEKPARKVWLTSANVDADVRSSLSKNSLPKIARGYSREVLAKAFKYEFK